VLVYFNIISDFTNPMIAACYVSHKTCDIKGIIKLLYDGAVRLEKLIVAQLAKDVIASHCLVDKTTAPYSKPVESNLYRSHPTSLRRI
jgi:hypothetical protein